MRDQFGNVLSEDEARALLAKKKRSGDPEPAGYAGRPGRGPQGETCGSCRHLFRNRQSKTYLKCSLMQANWTGGRKTDVLARSPACERWEALA